MKCYETFHHKGLEKAACKGSIFQKVAMYRVCLGEGGKDGKVNGVFWKKC